jgi:putative sigma-54 modulation protein
MSPDEAVMELETSDNQFLVFRNSVGGKAAVVFKRNDGNYGLVRP